MSVSRVPLLDLNRNHAPLRAELEAAFAKALDTSGFILGPAVDSFEKDCAAFLGVKHAIGVSSGTDALLLALMALDIGPGHEVICPSYTFFATAGSIARTGAMPVFVDSTPCCFNISPAGIAKAITPRTKAIMPVHLYGQSADMDPILEIARAHGIPVIEDTAQALGASYKGNAAGTLGDFGCYSFFPTKNLGAFGDAGLLTTNNDALAARARLLRTHGDSGNYTHELVGGNFRIDALQAGLLQVKLRHFPAMLEGRKRVARRYLAGFEASGKAGYPVTACTCRDAAPAIPAPSHPILLPFACDPSTTYNPFTLLFTGDGVRDRVSDHLNKKKNIGARIYYPRPLHRQPCFAAAEANDADFPFSNYASLHSLSLPIFPEMTDEETDYVVASVLEAV